MLRRHPKPTTALRCHDARHRLTPHTARRAATLPARHHCRPIVSKATRRIPGQAKIAHSTTAPAAKSLLRSSLHRRPRQSAHLPPNPPLCQIPIIGNRPTRRPAGSFLGGFRTPALRAHANSHHGPASETLHRSGPPSTAPRSTDLVESGPSSLLRLFRLMTHKRHQRDETNTFRNLTEAHRNK